MSTLRFWIALALVLAACGARAQDDLARAVEQVPAAIANARLVGSWEDGEQRGSYRIVVARDGPDLTRGRLFVQWVAETSVPPALRLTASVEVEELTALGLRIIDYRTEAERQNELVLHIDAVDPSTGTESNYFLLAEGPGAYLFKPADN